MPLSLRRHRPAHRLLVRFSTPRTRCPAVVGAGSPGHRPVLTLGMAEHLGRWPGASYLAASIQKRQSREGATLNLSTPSTLLTVHNRRILISHVWRHALTASQRSQAGDHYPRQTSQRSHAILLHCLARCSRRTPARLGCAYGHSLGQCLLLQTCDGAIGRGGGLDFSMGGSGHSPRHSLKG